MTTLKTTQIAFDTSRAERINANAPFPATLWDMVKQLLKTHKKSEICKALRISSGQIKQYCEENLALRQAPKSSAASRVNAQPQPIPAGDGFVTATPASQSFCSSAKENMSMLTLTGSNKTLQLSIPTSALPNVLPALGALL